jgi:hypothetical protein
MSTLGARRPLTVRLALLLVVYGLLVGGYGIHRRAAELPESGMSVESSRTSGIESSISVLDQGGPPLVAANLPYRQALSEHATYWADATDDPGIYLYLPIAGHLFGDRDALSLVRWFSILLMAVPLVAYPVIFYLLFDSLVLAFAAPLAVLFDSGYLVNDDIYFIESWAVLMLLPIVLVVARLEWRRSFSLPTLAGVAVVASFASSVRAQTGAGVAISALAVAVWRERGWRWRATAATCIVVGYVLVTPLAVDAVHRYSNSVAHPVGTRAGHPIWHGAYIGLGLLPNRWGLQWSDTVSADAVAKVDPTAGYLSPRYEAILRHLYFRIVIHNPLYVAHVYSLKAAIVVQKVWKRFWPLILLSPLVLLAGRRKQEFRRHFLLVVPSLLGALVPPVLTVPYGYDNGFVGAAALLALLTACGVYLLARDAVVARPALSVHRHRAAAAAVGAALLAALCLGAGAYADAQTPELKAQLYSSLLRPVPQGAVTVTRWGPQQLAHWTRNDSARVALRSAAQADVIGSSESPPPELVGPSLTLPPGSYAVLAQGRVLGGGLELQAYDPNEAKAAGSADYWRGQVGFDSTRMLARFTLARRSTIQVRFVGWPLAPGAPLWGLRSVEVARVPAI